MTRIKPFGTSRSAAREALMALFFRGDEKVKNVALLFTLILFISCSTTTFQPFTSQKYAPTKKVDLYTSEKPRKILNVYLEEVKT